MGIIGIIAVVLVFGLAFGEKEKPSKLPGFTKDEAIAYYNEELNHLRSITNKNKKHETRRRSTSSTRD